MGTKRRAFSLIEAVLVLALMALLMGGATLVLRGRLSSERLGDAVGRLVEFDRVTREVAQSQTRKCELRFDLNVGTLTRAAGAIFNPGGAYRISRVRTDAGLSQAGELSIPFSRRGQSPTYAMMLESKTQRQWIVVAGMTGKSVLIQDEHELDEIFRDSADDRRDAD